jgi:metallophosphoesterase (TIGR00282 family)
LRVIRMNALNVIAVGDIVGKPGRRALKELLPGLRERYAPCFVVANAENAAGGSGITPETAAALLATGADCLTTGDHFFDQKQVTELIEGEPRVLRPANWSAHAPGRGWGVFASRDGGAQVAVVNLMGRTFMGVSAGNFFDEADAIFAQMPSEVRVRVVDFHAEATSEKIAFGRYLDGRASLVVGTHTHVATADEHVLAGGTAYITDLGMTGPHDSVLGREYEGVLGRLRTGVPARFEVATGDVRLNGVVVAVDCDSGRASAIERISLTVPDGA